MVVQTAPYSSIVTFLGHAPSEALPVAGRARGKIVTDQ